MKDIKGIGFIIPSEIKDDYIKLDSLSSLSDCDIAVLDPSFRYTEYSTYDGLSANTYNGKPSYNHESSSKIRQHTEHWKNEINAFLKSGKTLFVILSEKKTFYIKTGEQTYSGTGRNRQVTNIVTDYNNYNFLPKIDQINYLVAHGKTVISVDPLFSDFIKQFGTGLDYQMHLETTSTFKKGLMTKNRDKTLGGVFNYLDGHIVFLPKLLFDTKSFIGENNDWNPDGIATGNKFKGFLYEVDKLLTKSSDKTPRPSWIESTKFRLKRSLEIDLRIAKKNNDIQKLGYEVAALNRELEESERLNDLLFESGFQLENAVGLALSILGYNTEKFDDGSLELDHVLSSPEGHRYIAECEGKDNKPIDISKFRQLSDALNEDFEREDIDEKAFGLLIGNPFRFTPPDERGDPFTLKCLSGAKRERIGLIETYELYKVCKYLEENNDDYYKSLCRTAIHSNLGNIVQFPPIPSEL